MSDSDSDVAPPPPQKPQQRPSGGAAPGEEVEKLKTRIVELETEVASLTSQLDVLRGENDEYKSQIEQLQAQFDALLKEKEQLQAQLHDKTAELEREVAAAKKEAEEAVATAKKEAQEAIAAAAVAQEVNQSTNATPGAVTGGPSVQILGPQKSGAAGPQQPDSDEVVMLKLQLEEAKQQLRRQEQLLLQSTAPAISMASAGTLQRRKPGEVTLKMRKNREEKLLAVRAQITAWLNKILSPDPPLVNETLMERLASGIIPCNLAIIVDDSAIPILGRVHLKASPYSILAHENVASFLRVCYDWGLKKVECFSPEDLLSSNVKNRNERLVVETLLSLSRVVYIKFGIEPPWIVKTEMAIDDSETNKSNASMMNDAEHEKLLEAVRAYCALHGIADIPTATELKGQFEFSDGTRSHIRMFEIDPENADGADREHATILDAVQNGELVLLVRDNKNWEELHKFLHEHSGGRKIDTSQVQLGAISAQTANVQNGSTVDETAIQPQAVEEEATVPQVVDVMLDTYGVANYEEEDEDDDDEDEEYLAECRRIAALEAQRAEAARLAAQQAEAELALRKAALLAQQEEEEEFQRTKHKNKFNSSYVSDADLSGDVGELLSKVRGGMGKGDFDPDKIDPEKANFSAIINTSDYKKFKQITMNEIQVMTNDDLERLAEYTAKQEFFYLTALAVKMTHELSYSSAFQVVTNQELWRRAIEQSIPFHRFYSFITNEITKSYLEQAALEKQSGSKDGVNLRSHRELMISNIKDRQKQKLGSSRE